MEITVFIETDKSGTYNTYTNDELPFGLLGEGKTVKEAIEDFKVSIEEMKSIYLEEGKEFPLLELTFQYDTKSFLKYYCNVF
jgi:predicted RNase H-like HicB family nuclease